MLVHPLLLGGLLLVGIPVLIHLTMRQKPKRLRFPALRFLQQRHVSNARSLRLRHLLLLGLRILLIVLACLALAHPRLFSGGLFAAADHPIAAVLVFDTSYSMEYQVAGQTRLAEAQRRADELLAEVPEGSRVAILDTSDPGEDWEPSIGEARRKVAALELCHARPRLGLGNLTVSSQLARAYRLFGKLDQEGDEAAGLPQVLYIFSDRARACWDASDIKDLERPEKVRAAFLDVGVEQPRDLAIVDLGMQPGEVVLPKTPVSFSVKVQAANSADSEPFHTELRFRLRGEPGWEIQSVNLKPGGNQTYTFVRPPEKLQPGFQQVEVQLGANDALPFDNTRFATFDIRESRKVLVLSDTKKDAFGWVFDLEYLKLYQCDVKPADEAGALGQADLKGYALVCVVRFSEPSKHLLWPKLKEYVTGGGRVILVPGGEDWQPEDSYRGKDATARELLPAALEQPVVVPRQAPGVPWVRNLPRHPLLEPFREWQRDDKIDFEQEEGLPRATGYWVAKPYDPRDVIVTYADPELHPALVERNVGKGRVLLFTTPFEDRRDPFERQWNNYTQTSFSRVLLNEAANYMAGDSERPPLNFLPGQRVPVPLPPGPRALSYTLIGPGITAELGIVTRGEDQGQLLLDQAVLPGNYAVYDGQARRTVGAFSINFPAAECRLERVPVEEINQALGENVVVPVGRGGSLRDVVADHWPQPMDLFPWLMIGLLLVLAVENLLSNRFYGRAGKEEEKVVPVGKGEGKPEPVVMVKASQY